MILLGQRSIAMSISMSNFNVDTHGLPAWPISIKVNYSKYIFNCIFNICFKYVFKISLISFPCVLFDLDFDIMIQPSVAFPPLYRDLYRLLIATSIDHWVPWK